MANAVSNAAITVRPLDSIDEIRKIPDVEQKVWGGDDRDIVPVLLLIAAKEAGSILLGAFDGERMVGFAFGFPGLEDGQISIHSHMTAVLPEYRDLNLGYKLKIVQRERTLAAGVNLITWTFDPLQARNAHFNFAKLGVISNRYRPDFYGRESTSTLHQNGTDRLWVSWHLASERVCQRTGRLALPSQIACPTQMLLRSGQNGAPARANVGSALSAQTVGIQIPSDISAIEQRDVGLAWEWREETRWVFTEALKSGFFVADFVRGSTPRDPGVYVLRKDPIAKFLNSSIAC